MKQIAKKKNFIWIFVILLAVIIGKGLSGTPVFAEEQSVTANNVNELQALMQIPGADFRIIVREDMALTSTIQVPETTRITLICNDPVELTLDSGVTGRHFVVKGELIIGQNVTVNGAVSDAATAGGVLVNSNGKLVLPENGGTIKKCKGEGLGGGVCVLNQGTFQMDGGTISDCVAAPKNDLARGGGVYVGGDGVFRMSGGTITGGEAYTGGGVHISENAALQMTGGNITMCKVTTDGLNGRALGGGVYVNTPTQSHTISGGKINGCTAYRGAGIYQANASKLELKGSAQIINCNVQNFPDYSIYKSAQGGGIYIAEGAFLMKESSAISNCASESHGGGLYVTSKGAVTIGETKSDADTSMISSCNAALGAGIYATGPVTINSGQILNCVGKTNGGGIFVTASSGIVNINGGQIKGCRAGNGGGVFNNNGSQINMAGGEILGCSSTSNGGGATVSGGKFTMDGSDPDHTPRIKDCVASAGWAAGMGGGIYVTSNGVVDLNRAEIINCEAKVTSSSIKATSRFGSGGGIYLESGATCTLDETKIKDCKAQYHGGGVFTRDYNNLTTTAKTWFENNSAKIYRIPGNVVDENPSLYPCTKAANLSLDSSALEGRTYPLNNYDINYLSYVVIYYENAKSAGVKGSVDHRVVEYKPFETGDGVRDIVHTFETMDDLKQKFSEVPGEFKYDSSTFVSWANATGYVPGRDWFETHLPGESHTFWASQLVEYNEGGDGYKAHHLTVYGLWQKELTIKKEVIGIFADKEKKFDIHASYLDVWSGAIPDAQLPQFLTEFHLKDGESATYDIYEEMKTTIIEDAASSEGYNVKYKVELDNGDVFLDAITNKQLMEYEQKKITITVVNEQPTPVITGIKDNTSVLLITVTFLIATGFIIYYLYRRRRQAVSGYHNQKGA